MFIQHSLQPAVSYLQSRFYDYLFNKKIVYNACMEDPAVDVQLMDFTEDSRVCMLASAGCNALHYAMEGAGRVDCVDANPCQYALVDLKLAVARHGDHMDLWQLFSDGVSENFRDHYYRSFRSALQPKSRAFWDRNLDLFDRGRIFKGFHFRTGCGFMTLCWDLLGAEAKRGIEEYFHLDDIPAQRVAFERVLQPYYEHFLSRAIIWFTVKFGIPSRQMRMIHSDARVVFSYLRDRIKESLTETAARDNYFHYLYFFGRYREDCCPEYLRADRFEEIGDAIDKVHIFNEYLAPHLDQTETRYTHFCLLDHLDWLHHDPELLARQWRAVLSSSEVGAKLLIRTYLDDDRWMSPFVRRHTQPLDDEQVRLEVARDRVGIYNRTHLLQVTRPL